MIEKNQNKVEIQDEDKDNPLNSTVLRLGLVSFFADISSEMLYPITPIFLTTILGSSMTSVGFIEGLAEAIASLLKTYSGVWSDKIAQRKPFVIVGYFLSAIAKPIIGASTSWLQVLFARGLDRTGKGIRNPPRDALLAEAVSEKVRGAAFGWHRGIDSLGAVLGPLLALAFFSVKGDNLRNIFYLAVVPGLLAVAVVFTIREKKHSAPLSHAKTDKEKNFFSRYLAWNQLSRSYKNYILSWTVFSLANSSDVFLLMKARQQGASLRFVIVLYCFCNLIYALLSPYFGKLSDKISRRHILLWSLLIFTVTYAGFALADSLWQYWILFAIYGLYLAASDGVGKAYVVDLIDPKFKGTGIGILGTVTGIATVIASTAAGKMWDVWGPPSTFYFGALGAFLGFILLFRVNDNSSTSGRGTSDCEYDQ